VLLDSDTLTTTGTEDVLVTLGGAMAFKVTLDLTDLTAADTIVVRYTKTLDGGVGDVPAGEWEIVYGTTVDWNGAIGVDVETWESPILDFVIGGEVTVEQTVGSPTDIVWNAIRVKDLSEAP
jgi:hypothetical protein